MSPAKLRSLFSELFCSQGFELYISIAPSPFFVLKKPSFSCLFCFPCSATNTPTGPRADLRRMPDSWSQADTLVFYEESTNRIWLFPSSLVPPGKVVALTSTYDQYLLSQRIQEHEEENTPFRRELDNLRSITSRKPVDEP